ncbi:MAG: hypothetical protein CMG80_02665 [Marinobacter sp.]|jgi:hypothetical protein|nr:hypothetical protein [Marinobacter sp.]|tara:strand:+ start:137 stop:406 length:270 start_codon:yes stop_codon:yes gene_type:complete
MLISTAILTDARYDMTRFAAPDQGRTRTSKMHKQAEPLDQHVCDAMAKTSTKMVSKADNEAVCEAAERWIREATRTLPKSDDAGAPNDG